MPRMVSQQDMGDRPPVDVETYVALQRLVHRYADAVVHRDAAQWGDCWADDAVWDLGRGRRVEGRAAIVELWGKAMGGMAAVVQNVVNGDAWHESPASDRAVGRWYINERFRRADGAVGILLAHYDDEYVRTDAGWRFANRVLEIHYQGPPDLTADFTNTDEGLAARRAATGA